MPKYEGLKKIQLPEYPRKAEGGEEKEEKYSRGPIHRNFYLKMES